MSDNRTVEQRFTDQYDVDESGCHLWRGHLSRDGYGLFHVNRKPFIVHRWSYQHFVGPIPGGLVLDHLCGVRHCVNPDHLEPVTQRENLRRSGNQVAKNMAKTHCKRGHELAGDNLLPAALRRGYRDCRACANLRRRALREMS